MWGGPEARRRQALAAAVLLAGGKARCGAPFGAWLGALEAAKHEERNGQGCGVDCVTVARRGSSRRRETSAFMADPARVEEGVDGVARVNRELTLKSTEVVARSQLLCGGRNRRKLAAAPAMKRLKLASSVTLFGFN